MIRINLMGGRRLGRRFAGHPLVSGLLTFVLVILVTIGFFRLLRTPGPALLPEVTSPAKTGEVKTEGVSAEKGADLEQGQSVSSSPRSQTTGLDTIEDVGAASSAGLDEGTEQAAASAPGAVATADTGREELSSVSLMARMQEILPPLVWFSSLRADWGGEYALEGFAFSAQRAREFVAKLSSMSTLCGTPGPITAEADSYGRLVYHFTVCGTTGRGGPEGRLSRAVISEKEFAALPDLLLSEGRQNGLSFPRSVVWEERRGSEKRGSLLASGGYDQVVVWLLALEKRGVGRYLTSFSVSPAPGPGPADNTLFSGTIDVTVQ